jgi:hypoxanthine phosphoribosyltransferase
MHKLSWNEVEDAIEKLSRKIISSGFSPDYIIGVTTGGLFPLAFLAKRLKINTILTVSAKKSKSKVVSIKHLPKVDLKNKKILLVDEIAESGRTLKKISEMLRKEYSVSDLKIATLAANKDVCEFWPDYYIIIEKGDWVIFPWEKEEFPPYNLKK